MIRRIHTYAGLLTFVNLVIFGTVGISASLESKPGTPGPPVVTNLSFRPEPNSSDREVAERVCALLHLSLATPIQPGVIQHDASGRLVLDFYHANGRHRVTLFEDESRLQVETQRNTLWKYLDTLHTTTAAFHSGDWRMQLWAWYNEFALWSLIGMVVSGLALWLGTRAGDRLAHLSLALGCCLFAALFYWIR